MKLCSLLAAFLALALPPLVSNAEDSTPSSELDKLLEKIGAKVNAKQKAAVADDIPAFDALLAKYRDQKTDEVARILLVKAMVYLQILGDEAACKASLERIKAEFPGTDQAATADMVLDDIAAFPAREKFNAALVGRPAPELNFKWASRGGLPSLSTLKGKVVVLDFWATWCGPCVASFPQMRELVEHYKDAPVEVVGITSLQGSVHGLEARPIDTKNAPDREMTLMKDYITAKDITWTIAFSEEDVMNPEYGVVGIPHMVIIAPDGTVRHTGLHPATPSEEKHPLIDAILNEFAAKFPSVRATKS